MNDKLSLIDFFKKYSRIEIPKIQRDYLRAEKMKVKWLTDF